MAQVCAPAEFFMGSTSFQYSAEFLPHDSPQKKERKKGENPYGRIACSEIQYSISTII